MTLTSRLSRATAGRALVVLGVLTAAVWVQAHWARPGHDDDPRLPGVLRWEQQRRPFWDSLRFTPLTDDPTLRAALGQAFESAALLNDLDARQRDNAADVLTQFLGALAAPDPDAYLRALAPLRRLADSPQESTQVLLKYKVMTGRPMPADMPAADALRDFWTGRDDSPGRPFDVALADPRGLGIMRAVWTGADSGKYRHDDHWMDRWSNPASTGFVPLTVPPETADAIIARHGAADVLRIDTVVRTRSGHPVPVCVILLWSPDAACWRVDTVLQQTDDPLFWPL